MSEDLPIKVVGFGLFPLPGEKRRHRKAAEEARRMLSLGEEAKKRTEEEANDACRGHRVNDLSPLELLVAEAIARSRSYINLAAVDAVDDGEPEDIRREARAVAVALSEDHDSAAALRAMVVDFCDGAENYQKTKTAWVPTPALRYLISDEKDPGDERRA